LGEKVSRGEGVSDKWQGRDGSYGVNQRMYGRRRRGVNVQGGRGETEPVEGCA